MYCRKCGSELLDGARFCTKCGEPVRISEEQTPKVDKSAAPVEPNESAATTELDDFVTAKIDESAATAKIDNPASAETDESTTVGLDRFVTPGADGPANVKLDDSAVTEPQDDSQNATSNTAKRRRRIKLVAALAAIVVVALIGVGAFTVLSNSNSDTVTTAYGSETPVTVTRSARIVPLSSEGTPLEYYVVRVVSAVDDQGNDINLDDESEEFEFSSSDGFVIEDILPKAADGTYVLEIDDGEQVQTTPPIVVDESQGITGSVLIESSEETQDATEEENDEEETDEVADEELYGEILDQFYNNVSSGWAYYEETYEYGDMADISYLFSQYNDYYEAFSDIDLVGYQFVDLDNDGTSELIIGVNEGEDESYYYDTRIHDLYTIQDDQIVHIASSGERYWYELCEDNTIYYRGSGGAYSTTYTHYELTDGELSTIECVRTDSDDWSTLDWYYSTADDYDNEYEIDEDEAAVIIDSWPQVVDLTLTPFSEYTPTGIDEDTIAEIEAMFYEDLPDMLGGDSELLDENIAEADVIEGMGVEEYLDSGLNFAYRYALAGYDGLFEGAERINVAVNSVSAVTVTDSVKIFTVEYTATIHDEIIRDESGVAGPDMDISSVATFVFNSDNKIISWTEEVIEWSYVE